MFAYSPLPPPPSPPSYLFNFFANWFNYFGIVKCCRILIEAALNKFGIIIIYYIVIIKILYLLLRVFLALVPQLFTIYEGGQGHAK